jgi:DNA helicase-2/ATP-dependent DNA helicase PcrA
MPLTTQTVSPFLTEIPPSMIECHEPDKAVEDTETAESYFTMIKSKFARKKRLT